LAPEEPSIKEGKCVLTPGEKTLIHSQQKLVWKVGVVVAGGSLEIFEAVFVGDA
jgi:hypothetical protein